MKGCMEVWIKNDMWVCMRDATWVGQDAQMGGIDWKGAQGYTRAAVWLGFGAQRDQEG